MTMRIIHFSDVHVPAVLTPRSFTDKRILGCCNSLLVRKHAYRMAYFEKAVPAILQASPDLIVFTGDAVSTADPAEFRDAAERFQPLVQSGIPLLYVPGNHDMYVRAKACREAMESFYTLLNGGLAYHDAPRLVTAGGVRFAAIHCAKPLSWYFSCGVMKPETSAFLETEAAKESDMPLVCVGHFPLLRRENFIKDFRRRLYGAETAASLLHQGRIALSLCGHIHHGFETILDESKGYGEYCAGSLTKEGSLLEITWDEPEKRFRHKRISFTE